MPALRCAPVRTAASTSIIRASAVPFASPMGTIDPERAASGSVVALPSAPSAQPSGIGCPVFSAFITLPRATRESDRSMTSGGAPARGAAKAMGLVPKIGSLAPHGAIAAGVLATITATSPSRANLSTCTDSAPP